jgi:protein-tyrosine phosphatase
MIDIHVHILPGLDDGPADWDTAVEMCRIAAADGIATLVATPHIQEGVYMPERAAIRDRIEELRRRVAGIVAIEILEGADVHYSHDLPEQVRAGRIPLINGKRYLLLELPVNSVPPNLPEVVFQLRASGTIPILTHPERNTALQGREDQIEEMVRAGACVQISAMSLLGQFGSAAQRSANRMLKRGMVHCLATDAHSIKDRAPRLSPAVARAGRIVGERAARAMVCDIPARIIAGDDIDASLLRPDKRRFFF